MMHPSQCQCATSPVAGTSRTAKTASEVCAVQSRCARRVLQQQQCRSALQHKPDGHNAAAQSASCSRRQALLAVGTAVLTPLPTQAPAAAAAAAAAEASGADVTTTSSSSQQGLQVYENTKQQYRLLVPPGWERKDKAGADVLFEDPQRPSTSVGVTVSPVRVATITQFGDLQAVGQRLLEAERKKESTLAVELLASSQRQGTTGAALYDYEYELDSTRGKKRIFNTVTITGSKLYILNGNYKCDKEAGCSTSDAGQTLEVLRRIAGSFDAGSS